VLEKEPRSKERYYANRKEYKFNQKLLTFLFFLVLASIFWLLNALDHNYSTNITFPIKYIHQMPNKEMVGDVPKELNLNVSGRGYTLLRDVFTASQHPIILRAMSLSYDSINSDSNNFSVQTRSLKEIIQRQLGTEITLNYITPDTIFYEFSPIERKKVPVEPNLDIEYASQYMLGSGVTSKPDSIIVSGPHSLTDTIKKVQTVYKKFSKVDKSFSVDFNLIPITGVYFVKKQVAIFVPVEKFTESFIMVPVIVINLPDSMEMKTFPASIKINYIVSLRNYNKVRPQQFRAIVDYRNINSSINNKLKVTLERQPAFVKSVSFRPKTVDYIIEK
jgi:hypothetical protein